MNLPCRILHLITFLYEYGRGYTAPEYLLYGALSDKVNTFSFGIVILEIISGRKCTYRNFGGPSTDCLLEHVR
ncbi:putative non-specific serine/threonine protein kinase [Helianthus debilis subsp. tardiflorus]